MSNSPDLTPRFPSLIAPGMAQVDALIAQRLDSSAPLVGTVSQYIISAGGKRLRPSLLLLIAGALNYQGPFATHLAVVVEFIHTATLLHDDVVDDSTLRRGRATANSSFGNPASVLVGDFLYSRAFQMMVESGEIRVMEILAEATNVIAEGEVLQFMNMHDATLNPADYLRVIRSKTAKLFEASARLPAVLAGSPKPIEEACGSYGQAIGTAFQVIDDVLDYEGQRNELGKNLGDDLREGKITLPLIVAMQRGNEQQTSTIKKAIEGGLVDELPAIVTIIQETGAMEVTRQCAAEEAQRAIAAIACLPETEYKKALIELAHFSLGRRS